MNEGEIGPEPGYFALSSRLPYHLPSPFQFNTLISSGSEKTAQVSISNGNGLNDLTRNNWWSEGGSNP